MTEREQFADWWERRGPEAVHMSWTEDACWFAWQASRRAAIEEAASIVNAEAENARQERYYPGVVGAFEECAAAIHALADGDKA
jgi:hypothetical protein